MTWEAKTDEKGFSRWKWLQADYLKKMTLSLLMAAQDPALATRTYRAILSKEQGSKKYRMCGERNGTVMNIFKECSKTGSDRV